MCLTLLQNLFSAYVAIKFALKFYGHCQMAVTIYRYQKNTALYNYVVPRIDLQIY